MSEKQQNSLPYQELSNLKENQKFQNFERALPIKDFLLQIDDRDYDNEFQYLKQITQTREHDRLFYRDAQIQHLNRYADILPYVHSIVKPQLDIQDKTYYINANYIRDINNWERKYIATQGPLKQSVQDFWHMIWTNNVGVIIMLCKLFDRQRIQCERYWPSDQAIYGPYQIDKISCQESNKEVFESSLIMKSKQKQHQISHYQWCDWPDFGIVKEDSYQVLDWLAGIANEAAQDNKIPVIHCSAGVGRTGTFLAICHIKQLLIKNDAQISIFSIVRRLREQRPFLVQSVQQYEMIYKYTIWLLKNLKYM
ncbi:unnamed protein product [Paramecium pentaurelia]|uniref:Protein tyrosine phosphatase n=1 Tax=Paramecium pentaurelia TaxID=43138 RepID=A0A8S1RVM5_9CILI|nr:unnamed protein product [Paramecium pentaurelia]